MSRRWSFDSAYHPIELHLQSRLTCHWVHKASHPFASLKTQGWDCLVLLTMTSRNGNSSHRSYVQPVRLVRTACCVAVRGYGHTPPQADRFSYARSSRTTSTVASAQRPRAQGTRNDLAWDVQEMLARGSFDAESSSMPPNERFMTVYCKPSTDREHSGHCEIVRSPLQSVVFREA